MLIFFLFIFFDFGRPNSWSLLQPHVSTVQTYMNSIYIYRNVYVSGHLQYVGIIGNWLLIKCLFYLIDHAQKKSTKLHATNIVWIN